MNDAQPKVKAILEVICVLILVLLIVRVIEATDLSAWQSAHLGHPFLNHTTMIAVSLLVLALTRRDFAAHGISFKNMKYHLLVTLICLLPILLASSAFNFADWQKWDGAFILSGIYLALLFIFALLLRKKPTAGETVALGALFLLFVIPSAAGADIGKRILGFIYFLFFVGLGEEMLFRGYIQSRLNSVFGRPRRFFGVNWGWGIIITSLLFGLAHIFNDFNPFLGKFGFAWPWGFWTVFIGLAYGYLREKTGSIVAPAILHGLPRAVAALFFAI